MDCCTRVANNPSIYSPSPSSKVLSRQEGKALLGHLKPGTELHDKLQHALMGHKGIQEIISPQATFKIDTMGPKMLGGFGSSEHMAIGESVTLKGLPKDTPLLVKGATLVKFHHIVALAGDFYGVPGQAISLPGGDDELKTERFKKAFETLSEANDEEIRKIILEIENEAFAVRNAALPHHCYSSQMLKKNQAIKKIKGDIDQLLIDNSDHFSVDAHEAYRIGHTLALNTARAAGEQNNLDGLKKAYAIDAFACHFLTDLFAAGHIRNQRGKLETFLTGIGFPPNVAKPLAGLLTGAQHEKDGNDGLDVENERGEHWRAYGDGCFWTPKNRINKEKVGLATQQSADEVYQAYHRPNDPLLAEVYALIPHVTQFNPPPLYSINQECTELHLFEGTEIKTITDKSSFLDKGIAQALRYLPRNYVSGFIDSFIRPNYDVPLLNNVIIPQIDRMTGGIWRIVGVASYHKINQQSEQMSEQLNETAANIKVLADHAEDIISKLQGIESQMNELISANRFQDLLDPIRHIRSEALKYKEFYHTLDEEQMKNCAETLFNAYNKIASVLKDGVNAGGRHLLSDYKASLERDEDDNEKITILTTLWFREILDYQIEAFKLYCALRVIINKSTQINNQIEICKQILLEQIETHKDFIDENLIHTSSCYIKRKLQKHETNQKFLNLFQ